MKQLELPFMEQELKNWVEEATAYMYMNYRVRPMYWGMVGEEALETAALAIDAEETPEDYAEWYANKYGMTILAEE